MKRENPIVLLLNRSISSKDIMMGFVWGPDAEICAQRGVGLVRGEDRRGGKSRMIRSFKALDASHDKGGCWRGHEVC